MSRLEVGQKGGDERKEGERQGGREEKRHREERGIKKGKGGAKARMRKS